MAPIAMINRESTQDLDLVAADWAVRIDRGLSAEEQARLDAWAAADVRRHGALIRALAILEAVGPAAVAANDPPRLRPRTLPRREALFGGLLAASFAGAAALFAGQLAAGQVYATARGKLRTVTLADGSRVWLNTASRVRVRYSRERRDITLLAGEALFDVAKDPHRPFVVRSGAVDVRALGTSFSVSQLPNRPVEIMVREGHVEVGAETAGAPPPTPLRPGCRAQATQAGDVDVRHVGVPAVLRALSWRQGLLDFQSATLADATLAFARNSDPQIVLDAPELGRETVDGQYPANDPEGFARTVARDLNLRLVKTAGAIHLTR